MANITYGNRGKAGQGMVLAAWNTGNTYLENKTKEIEAVTEPVNPHLLVVSKGNLRKSVDQSTVQMPVYKLFTAKIIQNPDIKNISRVLILNTML